MRIVRKVEEAHASYDGQSWKNVISFGDSDFERYGTIAAAQGYMRAKAADTAAAPATSSSYDAQEVAAARPCSCSRCRGCTSRRL